VVLESPATARIAQFFENQDFFWSCGPWVPYDRSTMYPDSPALALGSVSPCARRVLAGAVFRGLSAAASLKLDVVQPDPNGADVFRGLSAAASLKLLAGVSFVTGALRFPRS
jgi:hypothetical protein